VRDREDADLCRAKRVEQCVGEAVQEAPSHPVKKQLRRLWERVDLSERVLDLDQEDVAETGAPRS
jgi:hypothetical protein